MLNSGITSTISLRTRGSFSYPTNNYSHCSNGRRTFACSSPMPCCACCFNSIYNTVPSTAMYGCSLYRLRQSSLIQWSPCRRLISGGFDCYSRLPAYDVDLICYCDRVCDVRENRVGRRKDVRESRVVRRKGGLSKCSVYEGRSEGYELGSLDEAEVLLSLLTEDVGEECLVVRKETRRLVRKPVVEKREKDEVCCKCGSEKKRADVGVSEGEPRVSVGKNDHRRRNEIIQRKEDEEALLRKNEHRRRKEIIRRKEEEEEALLREESRKERLREDHKVALLKKRTEREKEEREALLRKASQDAEEKQERELILRKENQKVRSRTEAEENFLRSEEHRQKLRKDGSSCSSYYSLSSNGDYESDKEIEVREGRFQEDSSSDNRRTSRNDEIVYQDTRLEDHRREDYREDHGYSLTKKNSSKEFHTGSVIESDFRKKSEKRLTDVSVEEMESRKEASLKDSKTSMAKESNYAKNSDLSVSYDDRKVKYSGIAKYDEERKKELRKTGNEVSKESETMLKYKESVERQDIHSSDVRKFTGSQKVYSGKDEISAKVTSSNQETVGERQAMIGLSTREDDYQRNSRKFVEVSEVQEIDIRKSSTSQQRFETNVRAEEYSNNTRSSINDATKQQKPHDQVSGRVESRGKSQQLTKRDGKFILFKETGELSKQDENANLDFGSSLEIKEPDSLIPAKITKKLNPRNESDELKKVLITHSGNSGALRVEDRNKTQSETPVTPPPGLPETGASSQGSKVQVATDGDAIESAAQLEKSSAHYVGEFVKQAMSEILSSEIQREKETYDTKVSHESSGDSHSKKHDLGSNNQQSGTKGPSDEMWKVEEPSFRGPSKVEVQDDASKAGSAMVKRTGRSLWNVIADIFLLRWSQHSESHSSGRKTGGRSSPNQSTSSDAWFSGHEAEENEEIPHEKEGRVTRQGLSGTYQEAKTRSQVEESPSSSTLEAQLSHAGTIAPSSSIIRESGSLQTSISLPSAGEISEEHTSSGAGVDSLIPMPALRLRRAPAVRGDLDAAEAHASDSGTSVQMNTGSVEQAVSMVSEGEVKQKKLLRKDQLIRDRFDEWAEAYRLESDQRKIDEMFMREALLEAQKAADNWEVPVGAVLVHNGKIIARGCNLVEELRDSTAHAEILCIREASSMLRSWRLSETVLYVTLEPCPMCAGAILQARIDTVVWGAPNKLLGADGSWIRLFPGDGGNGAEQSDKPPAPVHPFHPKMTIRRGVLAAECAEAMQQFFKRRRKNDKKVDNDKKAETPSPSSSCLPSSNRPSKLLAKMHDAFNLMLCL